MRNIYFQFTFLFILLFGMTQPIQAIEVHQLTTPKGVKVWFSPDKTVPVISMAYSFDNAGTAHDPKGKAGLAMMASALLTQGAGELDANALSEKLAELAISIGFNAGKDFFRGSLITTLRTKKEAINLLKDVLYKAHLPKDRLEILRQQAISDLQENLKQPNYILAKNTRESLYEGHPYSKQADGTLDSLKGISVEDIKQFLKSNLALSNLRVSICGNLSKDEVIQLVDSIFSDLPKKATVTDLPELNINYSGKTNITTQNIPQSVCFFYHPGVNTNHKDFIKLSLITKVLGGGFESRLMQEIRKKNGLAYSVQSFLSLEKHAASLGGYIGTENAKINESIMRIRKEFVKLATFGITSQELKDVKKASIGSFVLSLSSTGAIASQLLTYQEAGYPVSFINEISQKINSIKLTNVNNFIKNFFDPQKLTFFVVGNPEKNLNKQ